MLNIQGLDLSDCLTDIKLDLVRTYKGEIKRTLTGQVAAFPLSFITVGFNITLLGRRSKIRLARQILLSSDVVEVATDYDGTSIKGMFSLTSNEYTEVRDKGERNTQLVVTLVSDGTPITDGTGGLFPVEVDGVEVASVPFGKVYHVTGHNQLQFYSGVKCPKNSVLVLGYTKLREV